MPPAATCCLLQTTRRHCKRRLNPAWESAVPYTVLLDGDGRVLYKTLGSVDILELRRTILANLPSDYIGFTNTGRLVPGKKTRRRVAADKIVRETRETQFSFLENQEPVLAVQEFTGNGSPKTYARTSISSRRRPRRPMKRYLPLLLAAISFSIPIDARRLARRTENSEDSMEEAVGTAPTESRCPEKQNRHRRRLLARRSRRRIRRWNVFRGPTWGDCRSVAHQERCAQIRPRSMRTSLPCSSRWQASPQEPREC